MRLGELNLSPEQAREIDKIVIVACGTSAYAGLVGKFLIEALARIPVEVDYGSEFRYRDPLVNERTAVLAITQSGETVDTLAAMEEARAKGALLWSIVNVVGSQAARLSDGVITCTPAPRLGCAAPRHSRRRWWISTCWASTWVNSVAQSPPDGRRELLDALVALPKPGGRGTRP